MGKRRVPQSEGLDAYLLSLSDGDGKPDVAKAMASVATLVNAAMVSETMYATESFLAHPMRKIGHWLAVDANMHRALFIVHRLETMKLLAALSSDQQFFLRRVYQWAGHTERGQGDTANPHAFVGR